MIFTSLRTDLGRSGCNMALCSYTISYIIHYKDVHLFPTEDEPLLWRRNAFLLLNSLFYPLDLQVMTTAMSVILHLYICQWYQGHSTADKGVTPPSQDTTIHSSKCQYTNLICWFNVNFNLWNKRLNVTIIRNTYVLCISAIMHLCSAGCWACIWIRHKKLSVTPFKSAHRCLEQPVKWLGERSSANWSDLKIRVILKTINLVPIHPSTLSTYYHSRDLQSDSLINWETTLISTSSVNIY